MSWLCEYASGRLLVQMQTKDTYVRMISKPKTCRQNHFGSIMQLETYHGTSYPV